MNQTIFQRLENTAESLTPIYTLFYFGGHFIQIVHDKFILNIVQCMSFLLYNYEIYLSNLVKSTGTSDDWGHCTIK